MAGYRRTKAERNPDGSPRPTSAAGRAERIRQKMETRFAAATTESERLVVAYDYLRSAAARARVTNALRTDFVVASTVRHLLRTGDELLHPPGELR